MRLSTLLTCCLLLFTAVLSAQLESRYVMAASFSGTTSLTTTTHQTTLNFQSDQLGSGYLANQIQTGWRVLTSTRRQYEITTINSTNFSSAQVVLTEIEGTTLAPNGVAVVYEYDGSTEVVPPLPVNSTGISAALQSVILIHNFALSEGGGGSSSWNDLTDIPPGFADGTDNEGTDDQTWAEVTGKPTTFPSGDDSQSNELQGLEWLGAGANTVRFRLTHPSGNETLDFVFGTGLSYSVNGSTLTINGSNSSPYVLQEFPDAYDLDGFFFTTSTATPVIAGSAAAGYTIDIPDGEEAYIPRLEIEGSSTTSNATGELVLFIESINIVGIPQLHYTYQLYDLSNNQKVDEHLTGNVAAQTIDGVYTKIVIPNIGGNYPNGFRLILN